MLCCYPPSNLFQVSNPADLQDFGYDSGRNYTLEQFKQMADRFEMLRCRGKSIGEKEEEYWRIINSGDVSLARKLFAYNFRNGYKCTTAQISMLPIMALASL